LRVILGATKEFPLLLRLFFEANRALVLVTNETSGTLKQNVKRICLPSRYFVLTNINESCFQGFRLFLLAPSVSNVSVIV